MRVLLDMNLSPRWKDRLNEAHIQAVHWSEVGRSDDPDTKIVHVALQFDYILLTQDLDFGIILAATNLHKPSVVQLRCDELSPNIIGTQICQLFHQYTGELQQGALITFSPRRTKLRRLPLRQ